MSPARQREIAIELARPIVEYINDTMDKGRNGMLTQQSMEDHAREFFDMPEEELVRFGYCMHNCTMDLIRHTMETIVAYPEVAISFLGAAFHLHILTHKMRERVLDKEFKFGQ